MMGWGYYPKMMGWGERFWNNRSVFLAGDFGRFDTGWNLAVEADQEKVKTKEPFSLDFFPDVF